VFLPRLRAARGRRNLPALAAHFPALAAHRGLNLDHGHLAARATFPSASFPTLPVLAFPVALAEMAYARRSARWRCECSLVRMGAAKIARLPPREARA
jgi:hypothetical protein